MTQLQTETITYSKTHLVISDEISFEEWQQAVGTFARLGDCWQWWLGDLLKKGEEKWGEMYAQALDSTQMRYQTLANLKWVAKQFPPHRRLEGVSWSHHSEVAAIESVKKQDQLLKLCETKGFSVKKLRKHLAQDSEGMLGETKEDGNFPGAGKNGAEPSGPIPQDAATEDRPAPKLDLTDKTTKRQHEKILKELDTMLRIRIPNMFLKDTWLEEYLLEVQRAFIEAGK